MAQMQTGSPASVEQWTSSSLALGLLVEIEAGYFELIVDQDLDIGLFAGVSCGRPMIGFDEYSGVLASLKWTMVAVSASERAVIILSQSDDGVFALKIRSSDFESDDSTDVVGALSSAKYVDIVAEGCVYVDSVRSQKVTGSTDSLATIFESLCW